MKRAAIYCRVSTDEQAEKGNSLPSQLERCKRYADKIGYQVVAELSDDISGMVRVQERPGGNRLLSLLDTGDIDAVIVYRLDRLSRDLVEVQFIAQSIRDDYEAELHVEEIGEIRDDDTGDFSLFMYGFNAKREHKDITERTIRGKYEKASGNAKKNQPPKPVMTGHPPYGYKREGKREDAKMFIFEPDAKNVRSIFEWYVNGDGGNGPLSLNAIASKLDADGIGTPEYRSNAAQYWIPATIKNILNNPIYTGVTHYGKSKMIGKGKKKRRVKQPRDEWVEIPVPELAIIPRSLYDAAQVRGKRNLERSRRNQQHEYLLTGHFRCGACNSAMAGNVTRAHGCESLYYRCGNHWRNRNGQGCANSGKTIAVNKAEPVVWEWVSNLIKDDETLLAGLRRMAEQREQETAPKQERLRRIIAELGKVDAKITRLVNSLADEDDATLAGAIKTQLKVFTQQKDAYQEERGLLELDLSKQSITAEYEQRVLARVRNIRKKASNPTFQQIREVLDDLEVQVVFYDDEGGRRLWVKCGVAPDGASITLHHSLETISNQELAGFVLFSTMIPV